MISALGAILGGLRATLHNPVKEGWPTNRQEPSRRLWLINGENVGYQVITRYALCVIGEVRRMIDPERGYMNRRGHNGLYKESDKTRGHERSCPDQVEIEPRLTEKREAEPFDRSPHATSPVTAR